jgi:peptidoglycan/LPS O-acetylase OafA/YrhL
MVFFTLSGFLITALLLEERARDGRVSLGEFYARRALRLLPALVVFLVVGGAFYGASPAASGSVLLYVANWASLMGVELGGLGHTWSLAVEEQFYLVWPVAMLACLRWRNGLLWLCAVGIAGSCALRLVLWDGGAGAVRIYRGSDTEAFALLVGCLLAVLLHRGLLRPSRRAWPTGVALGAVLALGLVPATDWTSSVVVPLVAPLAAAVAIWGVAGDAATGWLAGPVLRYVGRRSYALYLWHSLVLLAGTVLVGRTPAGLVLSLAALVLVVETSWLLVEAPCLRLKGRFEARREGPAGGRHHRLGAVRLDSGGDGPGVGPVGPVRPVAP